MEIVRLTEPRPLSGAERSIIGALLASGFPGSEELRSQVPRSVVVGRCDCGCPTVDIEVPTAASRAVPLTGSARAPVEGRVAPLGDEPVGELLLFVSDGYISSLEYVFYADTPPLEWPSLHRVEIVQIRG
jgi:hypothetical protein